MICVRHASTYVRDIFTKALRYDTITDVQHRVIAGPCRKAFFILYYSEYTNDNLFANDRTIQKGMLNYEV